MEEPQWFSHLRMLDIFPKTVDDAKEPSASGGSVSILVFIVVIILFLSEVIKIFSDFL